MSNADTARLTVERVLLVAEAWLAVMTELRLLDLEIQMRAGGACSEDGIVDAVAWTREHYRDWRVEALETLRPQIMAALAEP
jgi:hypothetical protein